MRIHEKIRVMRQCKGWTQEEMAEKLGWAVNSYAKIERGESDIKLDKLKKISEVLDIDIQQLIDSNKKTILNFAENCCNSATSLVAQGYILLSEAQCVHELEKAHLIIEQKNKEINWLHTEIARLNEIIQLLKRHNDQSL